VTFGRQNAKWLAGALPARGGQPPFPSTEMGTDPEAWYRQAERQSAWLALWVGRGGRPPFPSTEMGTVPEDTVWNECNMVRRVGRFGQTA
jgi:hypothetical protein